MESNNKDSTTKIDTNLYSRQIGTFGMEAMSKLVQLKVLIIGLRGLGMEVAKNIVLAGPKQVTLHDEEIVTLNDLGANFYLQESNVGKYKRADASLTNLVDLNPNVKVDVSHEKDLAKLAKDYNVVVLTEILDYNLVVQIDEVCRQNKGGFIYAANTGLSGFAFVDFGADHSIRDENGEECKQYIVSDISKANPGIVMINDHTGSKLALSDGDYVKFTEVNGMSELNDGQPREIKYVSPIAFSIGDTSSYGNYLGGGLIEQVRVPKSKSFKSFKESVTDPYNNKKVPDPIDLSKFGRNELLHVGFLSLFEYVNSNKGKLPELNEENQVAEIVKRAKNIFDEQKNKNSDWINNSQEYDENIIRNIARWAKAELPPVTAFLGGVVAQEIVKFTGKYTPLDQWLWFDFFETAANLKEVNRTPMNTRYDDQVAVFGQEIQKKLASLNLFMIGAGALGCEFLKEFALMGISTKEGKLIVTDNDNIEISNLNRQFLFRKDDVSTSKSKTACREIKKMNKEFQCSDQQALVCPDNEHVFDGEFWQKQDFVINAVDNIKARKYIDAQCTWNSKPLIDSGTLGTKAHVQMIVPHVTSCYNDTQDPVEESIPMCTLHNFPSMIEHCIEWGRDHFTGYFTMLIDDAQKLIAEPKRFYSDLKKEGNITLQLDKVQNIKKLIEIGLTKSFDKCIELAVLKFTENFDHKIKQLLFNFPPEYTNKDGSKFWSGNKRVPTPVHYDPNDELSLQFVVAYSILIGKALSIPVTEDINYIKNKSKEIKIPVFEVKKVHIKVNENEPEDNTNDNFGQEEEIQFEKLTKELQLYEKQDPKMFSPHEFEKDDDCNYHIDFIYAASNLRARNYVIKEADKQKTKMIAGKIIPAIATTTAAITGLVALQIYTLLQTNDITYMRNAFVNLGVNIYVLTEPQEKIQMQDKEDDPILLGPVKAIPSKWTVWDKIIINGPLTFRELIEYMRKTYGVDVSIISTANKVTLIQTFMASKSNNMDKLVEEVYQQLTKKPLSDKSKYITLEVSADTEDGAIALMPLIQYNYKK